MPASLRTPLYARLSPPASLCPPFSARRSWHCGAVRGVGQCARWCPSLKVIRFHGDPKTRAKIKADHFDVSCNFDVCLTTYECVTRPSDQRRRTARPQSRAHGAAAMRRSPAPQPARTAVAAGSAGDCARRLTIGHHAYMGWQVGDSGEGGRGPADVALPDHRRSAPHQERAVGPLQGSAAPLAVPPAATAPLAAALDASAPPARTVAPMRSATRRMVTRGLAW
jgi:hypothetical protein